MHQEEQSRPDLRSSATQAGPAPLDVAILLLELQQRMAALDRLYNEEISGLSETLSQLKAEFIRQHPSPTQGQAAAQKPKQRRRKAVRPEMPQSAPRRPSGG